MERIWSCNGLDGFHRDSLDSDSTYGTSSSPRSSTESSLSPSSPPPGFTKPPLFNAVCSIVCVVCRKVFSTPKVLPCFHTCCAKCIEVSSSNSGFCRQCRCEFPLPVSGVEGLITDHPIVSFIDSLKGQTLECTTCRLSDRIPAVAKCVYCDNFLCHVCVSSSGYMRCSTGHRVIEIPKDCAEQLKLTEMNTNSKDLEEIKPCNIHHDRFLKLYCGECKQPICSKCADDMHKTHRLILPIVDAETDFFKYIKNSLVEKETRLNELALYLSQTKQTEDWIRAQHQEIHSKINESYQEWAAALMKHRQTQLVNLDIIFSKFLNCLQNSSSFTLDAFDKTQRVFDFYWRLSKDASSKECIQFKQLIDTADARLTSFKPKPFNCNLKFITQSQDLPTFLHRTFGHVEYEVNGTNHDVARTSGQGVHRLSGAPLVKMQPRTPPTSLPTLPVSNVNANPFKYTRWSTNGLDDLKSTLADLDSSFRQMSFPSPYHCIRSSMVREVISYSWRFGSYGSLQGQFTEPNGVAVNDDGEIIVADTNNNRVQVFDINGRFKFSFGESAGLINNCSLLFPNRVAVTHSRDIIVSERAPTHQLQLYSPYGQFIRKFGVHVLNHPRAIAADNEGNIIVVECKIMRVVIFNSIGDVLQKFSCSGVLHFPNGVAVNDKKEIFISDNRAHSVVVYNYAGTMLRVIGNEGLTNYPIAVMLNKNGHVVVADNHNNFNLTVFTQEGELIGAYESKVKHAQCFDAAITPDGNTVVLSSKDYRVYGYCLENRCIPKTP